jgi:hypothetical protein
MTFEILEYGLGGFIIVAALLYTLVETDCDREAIKHPWEN